MSGFADVEALLEDAAQQAGRRKSATLSAERDTAGTQDERTDRRDRDRDRDRRRDDSRDRDRDRTRRDRSRDRGKSSRDGGEDVSDRGNYNAIRHRHKSRGCDLGRLRNGYQDASRFYDAYRPLGGDYYRGGGRARSRSRSPYDDRYYRPSGRNRRDHDDETRDRRRDSDRRDRDRDRDRGGRDREGRDRNSGRRRSPSPRKRSATPPPTEDERDRRTVFVQQLAARLRTKELIEFFKKVGPVKEAQIVKDRVSGRSKG